MGGGRGRKRQGSVIPPYIGWGRGGGVTFSHNSTPPTPLMPPHTGVRKGGVGGPAAARHLPLAHHPLIALERYCLFTDANTVETREKQVEGAPPPRRPALPPTLTQLPLWCKKKHKKLSRDRRENGGHSPCPQGRKDKYIHGGEAVAESCPNTALSAMRSWEKSDEKPKRQSC